MEFENIRRASRKEIEKQTARTIEEIKTFEFETVGSYYDFEKMLTPTQKTKTEAEQKTIIIAKIEKQALKKLKIIDDKITLIENAPDLIGLSLSVEWTSSKMWGANPKATASIHTAEGWEYFESGSIKGCGYDKESTATAEALNQSASVLKELYKVFEHALYADKTASPRNVLGYGSGCGCCPCFEGGYGVSCCYNIFKAIGFVFECVGCGKMFNTYTATKNK